jgi:hypothetical protein
MALSAGGRRIAVMMPLKALNEFPDMPTLPFDQGSAAS